MQPTVTGFSMWSAWQADRQLFFNSYFLASDAGNLVIDPLPLTDADAEAIDRALGLAEDEHVVTVLTFGYPAHPRDPTRHAPEEWIARADRKPFDEIVTRL